MLCAKFLYEESLVKKVLIRAKFHIKKGLYKKNKVKVKLKLSLC